MKLLSWLWPIVILGSSIVMSWVIFYDVTFGFRPFLALWFLFICPGMAVVRFLQIRDSLTEVAMAIGCSLGLDTAVAMVMLYAGIWSIQGGTITLAIMSSVGAILQIITVYWRRSTHTVDIGDYAERGVNSK